MLSFRRRRRSQRGTGQSHSRKGSDEQHEQPAPSLVQQWSRSLSRGRLSFACVGHASSTAASMPAPDRQKRAAFPLRNRVLRGPGCDCAASRQQQVGQASRPLLPLLLVAFDFVALQEPM
jgi:hypothetical protein